MAVTTHRHTYTGQSLTHSHEYGDREHGYFEHPEDGVDLATRPLRVPSRWPYGAAPVSQEEAHGDLWAARIRAEHERLGSRCPCGNGHDSNEEGPR